MTDLLTTLIEDEIIEIARKMLKEGLAKEIIEKILQIDEETINQLQAELNNA